MRRCLWSMISLLIGCGEDGPAPRPTFEDTNRVVVIGDNSATGPTAAASLVELLRANDDARFPELAGLDLATRGRALVDLSRGGYGYRALASLGEPICSSCVPAMDQPATVIVALGVNDLLGMAISVVRNRDEPGVLIEMVGAEVRRVLESVDVAITPRPQLVVVLPYDPSDGVGDLAAIAAEVFPLLDPSLLPPELVNELFDGLTRVIREEADRAGAVVVDARAHFLGHGYHHADPALPHHDPGDATRWIQHLLDPGVRGAHELRRITWAALTGDTIDTLPTTALPAAGDETLPDLTTVDWADAFLSAEITAKFTDIEGREWTNVNAAPDKIIGAPDGGDVALGVTGASIVVDLGEGGAATDGPGADVVVIERGGRSLSAPETYRVLAAASPDGPWQPLADGRGERTFDLEGSGFSSVRYLRIESNASVFDIMSGLGSALYPGPEIDAIGAIRH